MIPAASGEGYMRTLDERAGIGAPDVESSPLPLLSALHHDRQNDREHADER